MQPLKGSELPQTGQRDVAEVSLTMTSPAFIAGGAVQGIFDALAEPAPNAGILLSSNSPSVIPASIANLTEAQESMTPLELIPSLMDECARQILGIHGNLAQKKEAFKKFNALLQQIVMPNDPGIVRKRIETVHSIQFSENCWAILKSFAEWEESIQLVQLLSIYYKFHDERDFVDVTIVYEGLFQFIEFHKEDVAALEHATVAFRRILEVRKQIIIEDLADNHMVLRLMQLLTTDNGALNMHLNGCVYRIVARAATMYRIKVEELIQNEQLPPEKKALLQEERAEKFKQLFIPDYWFGNGERRGNILDRLEHLGTLSKLQKQEKLNNGEINFLEGLYELGGAWLCILKKNSAIACNWEHVGVLIHELRGIGCHLITPLTTHSFTIFLLEFLKASYSHFSTFGLEGGVFNIREPLFSEYIGVLSLIIALNPTDLLILSRCLNVLLHILTYAGPVTPEIKEAAEVMHAIKDYVLTKFPLSNDLLSLVLLSYDEFTKRGYLTPNVQVIFQPILAPNQLSLEEFVAYAMHLPMARLMLRGQDVAGWVMNVLNHLESLSQEEMGKQMQTLHSAMMRVRDTEFDYIFTNLAFMGAIEKLAKILITAVDPLLITEACGLIGLCQRKNMGTCNLSLPKDLIERLSWLIAKDTHLDATAVTAVISCFIELQGTIPQDTLNIDHVSEIITSIHMRLPKTAQVYKMISYFFQQPAVLALSNKDKLVDLILKLDPNTEEIGCKLLWIRFTCFLYPLTKASSGNVSSITKLFGRIIEYSELMLDKTRLTEGQTYLTKESMGEIAIACSHIIKNFMHCLSPFDQLRLIPILDFICERWPGDARLLASYSVALSAMLIQPATQPSKIERNKHLLQQKNWLAEIKGQERLLERRLDLPLEKREKALRKQIVSFRKVLKPSDFDQLIAEIHKFNAEALGENQEALKNISKAIKDFESLLDNPESKIKKIDQERSSLEKTIAKWHREKQKKILALFELTEKSIKESIPHLQLNYAKELSFQKIEEAKNKNVRVLTSQLSLLDEEIARLQNLYAKAVEAVQMCEESAQISLNEIEVAKSSVSLVDIEKRVQECAQAAACALENLPAFEGDSAAGSKEELQGRIKEQVEDELRKSFAHKMAALERRFQAEIDEQKAQAQALRQQNAALQRQIERLEKPKDVDVPLEEQILKTAALLIEKLESCERGEEAKGIRKLLKSLATPSTELVEWQQRIKYAGFIIRSQNGSHINYAHEVTGICIPPFVAGNEVAEYQRKNALEAMNEAMVRWLEILTQLSAR